MSNQNLKYVNRKPGECELEKTLNTNELTGLDYRRLESY